MSGTAHTEMQLDIKLGEHVSVEDTCFGDVPDGTGLCNVLRDEIFNGLVHGHSSYSKLSEHDRDPVGVTTVSSCWGRIGVKTLKSQRAVLCIDLSPGRVISCSVPICRSLYPCHTPFLL